MGRVTKQSAGDARAAISRALADHEVDAMSEEELRLKYKMLIRLGHVSWSNDQLINEAIAEIASPRTPEIDGAIDCLQKAVQQGIKH